MRKLVFVDESGNPGFKNEQGEFVMSAVVVLSESEYIKINNFMAGFKRGIHWSDEAEFKFVKTKKEILYNLLTGLKNYNFEIYCLILRKDKEIEVEKSTSVYNYMLAKLIDGIRHSDLWLMVDGAFGKEHRQKVRTYLRATLKHPIKNFKYGNSKSYNGLQLADVIAGIIHRHYSEKKDSEDLFGLIRDKIRLLDELK